MAYQEEGNLPSYRQTVTTSDNETSGVVDYTAFRTRVDEALASGELIGGGGQVHALVFFNVENFKHYNQAYGYAAGDVFVRRMAHSIRNAFPGSLVGRIAIDQFVVLCYMDEVTAGVRSVRSDYRREHKDSSVWLRAGYCAIGPEDSDAGIICDRAKVACNELRGRRDAYLREYDEVLRHEIILRRYVLEHFEEALEKGWIQGYCQPIVRVATGETCDVEVLARWIDPDEGVLPPIEFVPVLEEARLVHRLDLAILRDACRACRRLEEAGKSYVSFSVNLSQLDFELCDIVSEVEAVLAEYGIPRSRVSVEVTESALVGNQEFLRDEVDRFRSEGFEVWMDDFGSGYSSLNVLKDYAFDLIKIDMAFVHGIGGEGDDNSRIMVAKVIDLIKEMGVKTLAEGVETQEQYEFLRALGCGRAQGFLFGKPSPLPASIDATDSDKHPRVEPLGTHGFYEDVGRINLMRPDPRPAVNGHYLPSDVACAIICRRSGTYEYLNTNDLFVKFLEESGVGFDDACVGAIRRAVASGGWEEYVATVGEKKLAVRVRKISESPEYDVVAILSVVDEYYRAELQ